MQVTPCEFIAGLLLVCKALHTVVQYTHLFRSQAVTWPQELQFNTSVNSSELSTAPAKKLFMKTGLNNTEENSVATGNTLWIKSTFALEGTCFPHYVWHVFHTAT